MTLPQFAMLEKQDQINMIKQAGTFLLIRQEAGIDIILYQIDGFYAEVRFDGVSNHSAQIRSFDDTASLDIYLKQINLADLKHLLG